MSRKLKTLIIAFAILALLGGGYYGSMAWTKKKAGSASSFTPPPRLGNLDSSQLVKIEVPGIVLEKKGEIWELISSESDTLPVGYELDQGLIELLTFSLANIWADRIVDEEPEDLSVYGLDNPLSWAMITDSSGKKAEYFFGETTPSRTSSYFMEKGDPKVYSISAYSAEFMRFNLDNIRQRTLFPHFEPGELTRLRLEKPGSRIEIIAKPESVPLHLATTFSTHILTSPYLLPRGIHGEALHNLLSPLNEIMIGEFIDDEPSSLAPYGLDNPAKIFLQTGDSSIGLLIGDEINGNRYAKLSEAPAVFTLGGLESVINVTPFSLIDKFALLVNIDMVDQLLISGGERTLRAEFHGKGDDGVYYLDGKKTETRSFKTFYQAVIGLLIDAEYPRISGSAQPPAEDEELHIEYRLNTPPGERVSITLLPYNRDFYALTQNGTTEFLISRNQARNIFDTAEKVVFEDLRIP